MKFDNWIFKSTFGPIALGVLAALVLPSTRNQDLYRAIGSTPESSYTGKLSYAGFGRNQSQIETETGNILINCQIDKNRSWCLPEPESLNGNVTVTTFSFKGQNWILSVTSQKGDKIVDRKKQIGRLFKNAQFERQFGWLTYLILGLFLGIILKLFYSLLEQIFVKNPKKQI